ncbi:MAG TPA: YrdB family protein [Gemmatimonadaceae bacterium]|jgi:hypothetical protein
MDALRLGNLALRFLLELSALAAVGYWGATTATGRVIRIVLAIALPTLVAVVWALFISPKARIPTGPFGRAFLGLVVFLTAAAALWRRDQAALATIYGSLAVLSSVLILVWPQQVPDAPAR